MDAQQAADAHHDRDDFRRHAVHTFGADVVVD